MIALGTSKNTKRSSLGRKKTGWIAKKEGRRTEKANTSNMFDFFTLVIALIPFATVWTATMFLVQLFKK